MENNPLVTVNILSYNRKEELRNTLEKVYAQDYKNLEVIVVDNSSIDGSPEMVSNEFPQVMLIQLPKNIGISGWNEGFKIAKGEYVLVLDDDSYPDTNTIATGVKVLSSNNQFAAVSFHIYNTILERSETSDFLKQPYFFNGCGAMIRTSVFAIVGYYSDQIFIYYNELEFCARIYDNELKVIYLSESYCFHEQSSKSRSIISVKETPFKSAYRYSHYYKSFSIFIFMRISFMPGLLYFIKWNMNRILIAFFYGYKKLYIQSLFSLLKQSPIILKERKVLKRSTQRFYRYGNEVLFDREYFPNFKKPKIFQ